MRFRKSRRISGSRCSAWLVRPISHARPLRWVDRDFARPLRFPHMINLFEQRKGHCGESVSWDVAPVAADETLVQHTAALKAPLRRPEDFITFSSESAGCLWSIEISRQVRSINARQETLQAPAFRATKDSP